MFGIIQTSSLYTGTAMMGIIGTGVMTFVVGFVAMRMEVGPIKEAGKGGNDNIMVLIVEKDELLCGGWTM